MKQKILSLFTIILLLIPLIFTVDVSADENIELDNQSTFLSESLYDLKVDETNIDIDNYAIGGITVASFLVANPLLSASLLALGLSAIAMGIKFNSFQEAYDFGSKIKSRLTTEAYKLAVDGLKIFMTDDLKMAILRSSLGSPSSGEIIFDESPGVPYFLTNGAIYNPLDKRKFKIGTGFYDMLKSLDVSTSGLRLDDKVNGVEIKYGNLYTNFVKIEMWNTRNEFPEGIKGGSLTTGNIGSIIDNYVVTERNGIEFLFDKTVVKYSEYGSFHFDLSNDYNPRKLFYQNVTITIGDGTSYTYIGDTTANSNAFMPLDKYVNPVYPSGTTITVNDNYAIGNTGVIDGRDIPRVLGKEGGYTAGDREVIGGMIVDSGVGDWEWDDKDPDTDEETDGDGLGMFDWFLRIWNFLVKMLNPIKDDVKTIGKNLNSVGDFIAKKFVELDLYLESQFIAMANDLRALPGTIAKDMENLWADLGAVWSGIADDLIAMDKAMSDYFDNVMKGIDAGVKKLWDSLVDFQADVATKTVALNDAMAKGIDDIRTEIRTTTSDITTDLADIGIWLKDFFVPDFAGIKDSWVMTMNKIKLKFKPITNIANSFTGVFSVRKSIYSLEFEVFGQKIKPVPIELKPAIDIFRTFATAFCVFLTLTRIYKRFVGEDDVIAT